MKLSPRLFLASQAAYGLMISGSVDPIEKVRLDYIAGASLDFADSLLAQEKLTRHTPRAKRQRKQ